MGWFILGVVIWLFNLLCGISHYKKGKTNFNASFSWFAVGVMLPGLILQAAALLN